MIACSPYEGNIYTGVELLKGLQQITQAVIGYPDEENCWYCGIGFVPGNLSVQVFLATLTSPAMEG